MTRNLAFHQEALSEAQAARDWYDEQSPRAARAFVAELRRLVTLVAESPGRAPQIAPEIRRALFRRFPYALLYAVEPDRIFVLAVMHQHRRPGYWRRRRSDA